MNIELKDLSYQELLDMYKKLIDFTSFLEKEKETIKKEQEQDTNE